MGGKTALVTGANSGIGLETARELARMGASVVLSGRNPARLDEARSDIASTVPGAALETLVVDLGDLAATKEAAARFGDSHDRLDALVNNAGVVLRKRIETADGYESMLAVNHLGHFVLTLELLDLLKASAPARIVNVASDAHKFARSGFPFDDVQASESFSSMRRYGQTKLANILFTRELARRLEGTGVTVNAVHPGAVATNLGRGGDGGLLGSVVMVLAKPFFRSPARGAETTVWAATAPELEGVSGGYYADCRPADLTPHATDDEAAARLWEISEQLVSAAVG